MMCGSSWKPSSKSYASEWDRELHAATSAKLEERNGRTDCRCVKNTWRSPSSIISEANLSVLDFVYVEAFVGLFCWSETGEK